MGAAGSAPASAAAAVTPRSPSCPRSGGAPAPRPERRLHSKSSVGSCASDDSPKQPTIIGQASHLLDLPSHADDALKGPLGLPATPTTPSVSAWEANENHGAWWSLATSTFFTQAATEIPVLQVPEAEVEVRERVGSGTTAEVFRGVWRDQEVAIKRFKKAPSSGKREGSRPTHVHRELDILLRVSHPKLVELVAVCGSADGPEEELQLIEEYCDGGSLFHLLHLSDVELAWKQQIKMGLDIAEAVEYLHGFDPKICYRDLKSLNAVLTRPVLDQEQVPHLKLVDFGMSRMGQEADPDSKEMMNFKNEDPSTMTLQVGTLFWMAPEVFASSRYDERADAYSFGIVLFEIASREPPYEAMEETPEAAVMEQLLREGTRPSLEALPCDCPKALVRLMVSCWAQDPSERPCFPEIVNDLRRTEAMNLELPDLLCPRAAPQQAKGEQLLCCSE